MNTENAKINFETYRIYGPTPKGYPTTAKEYTSVVNAGNSELLPHYHKLWHLRQCEINNATKAFGKLLGAYNTTKQVYDNEKLRPFMPDWMKSWEPAFKEKPKTSKDDAAIIAELTD